METLSKHKPESIIVTSEAAVAAMLRDLLRPMIREAVMEKDQADLQEKLLSPSETCKLFQPTITKATLSSWTTAGRLKSYRIASRVFYKYSEVINSLQTLKRYQKTA